MNVTANSNSQTRIGLCTDTHYWLGTQQRHGLFEDDQLQPWSGPIQTTLLAELKDAHLDMVIHLGDFTCGGGYYKMPEAAFFKTLKTIYREFMALSANFRALPGNHDCLPGGSNWSYTEQLLGLEPRLGQTIDLPDARLVLLNAQGHSAAQIEAARPYDPIYGWVNDAELARLDEALATANKPVLVFVHQLLRPWVGKPDWIEFYRVENAGRVLDLLARHGNVRAVFQGHAHMFNVHQAPLGDNPCWFVITPSVITYPLGWLDLTLTPGQVRVRLRRLSMPDLAQMSRQSGNGQIACTKHKNGNSYYDWRIGHPEWRNFTIPLHL